ncbi:MAG: Gfo/Idh/MocA family protein, partial [Planctomycetaceae bacterium]
MPLDRRTFLKTAAVAATAAATKTALGGSTQETLHFAIIGAGGQGQRITDYFAKVPGTRLTAICDINPLNVDTTKKSHSEAKVYEDWKEMLDQERDLQAVLIGLPEHLHAPAAIDAMNAGKDVFCEKPMAYSVEQCRQMIAARDKNQRILQIGQQRRSNPLYYLAERLIQKDGVIGKVVRADAFWDRWSDWKRPLPNLDKDFAKWGYPSLNHLINWRLYREYGHGLMTENGTHQMDACSWLLGGKLPRKVCGLGVAKYNDGRETHDVCSAEYLFEGDTIVRFTQDFHQGFNYGWGFGELFLGEDGSLRINQQQELAVYDKRGNEEKVSIAKLGDIELG